MPKEALAKSRKQSDLLASYPEAEQRRITVCFDRLLPHFTPSKFAVTGGIALACQLATRGLEVPYRSLNDLDFVAEDMDAVHPELTKEFLVNHYHPPQERYNKFVIQLADSVSRLRIDIFPYLSSSPSRANRVRLGNWEPPSFARRPARSKNCTPPRSIGFRKVGTKALSGC